MEVEASGGYVAATLLSQTPREFSVERNSRSSGTPYRGSTVEVEVEVEVSSVLKELDEGTFSFRKSELSDSVEGRFFSVEGSWSLMMKKLTVRQAFWKKKLIVGKSIYDEKNR